MLRDYKIASHNSTVCGYPGRGFDWSKFCWDGSEEYDFGNSCYSTDSEFIPDELKGKPMDIKKAQLPYVDSYLINDNCEYLHIPYRWSEDATVFRVRPNESMYAGEIYRGYLVESVKAIKKNDIWYWRLSFKEVTCD